jgi:hypothetical protein
MRRLLDIAFIMLILLGCVGLDYYVLKRDAAGAPYGIADYIAQRSEDFNDLRYPPSLAAALPTDIDGWQVSTDSADKMVETAPEKRAQEAGEIALIKAVAALDKAAAPAGEMVGMTLTKGDTRLRVVAVLMQDESAAPPVEPTAAPSPDTAAQMQALMQTLPALAAQQSYEVVDGVAFTEMPAEAVTKDADLRMMRANLGADMAVTVVTRSTDDAAIKEAIGNIDFVMLNKLLANPVAGVVEGRTTDLRLDPENAALYASLAAPLPAFGEGGAASGAAATAGVLADESGAAATAPAAAILAPALTPKVAPNPTAVFESAPDPAAPRASAPCERRAGVLVCPD